MNRNLHETSVLILEDSAELREQLSRVLASAGQGFKVEAMPSSGTVMRKLTMGKYHLLVVDYDLAVGTAASVVRAASETDPHLPVIVISRGFDDTIYSEVARIGADSYVPITGASIRMLPDIVQRRIETRIAITEAVESKQQSNLKSQELEIIASLVRKMVETSDLKSVMQEMAEQMVKRLNMKVVGLQRFFLNRNGFTTFGIYPRGKLVEFAESVFGISLDSFVFPFDPENCIVDRYTAERRPWVGNDFAEVFGPAMPARAARMIQKFAGVKSIYNAPFYAKDRLLGGIIVGNVRSGFTEVEMEAFDAIVHVSSLLFEYNDSNKSQTVQSEKLKAIREAVSLLQRDYEKDGESMPPGKLLEMVHRKLMSIVPAQAFALFIHDHAQRALLRKKVFTKSGKVLSYLPSFIPLNSGKIGKAVSAGKSLLENDFRFDSASRRDGRKQGLVSLLAVPLCKKQETKGMILLMRSTENPFVDSDREILELFASQFDAEIIEARR